MTRRTTLLDQPRIARTLAPIVLLAAATAQAGLPESTPVAAGVPPTIRQVAPPRASAPVEPLTLRLQGPEGDRLRLQRAPGSGWKTLPGWDSAGRPEIRQVAYNGPGTPPAEEEADADDQLTVFIDGPSGYVFVWSAAKGGWKFVGAVAENPR